MRRIQNNKVIIEQIKSLNKRMGNAFSVSWFLTELNILEFYYDFQPLFEIGEINALTGGERRLVVRLA